MRNIGILTDAQPAGIVWLNNPGAVAWAGTGTPWTVVATSPFQLSINSRGAPYTPLASPPPAADSAWYDLPPVTETFTVQCNAATPEVAVRLIELLQDALLGRGATQPPLLVQAVGSDRRFAVITDVKVQELSDFFTVEYRAGLARVQCSITRSPYFAPGTLTTLLSSVTVGNSPAGGNLQTFPAGQPHGALAHVGTPLSTTFQASYAASLSSGSGWARIIAASVRAATTQNLNMNIRTNYFAYSLPLPVATLQLPTSATSKLRFLAKVTSAIANVSARVLVYLGTGGADTLYTSPWIACTGTNLIDFGGYQVPSAFTTNDANDIYTVEVQFQGISAATIGGTINRIEVLEYDTYGWYDAYKIFANQIYSIASARVVTRAGVGTPVVHARPHTTIRTSAGILAGTGLWRGEPPVARRGNKLWLAWGSAGGALDYGPPEPYLLAHNDSESVTLTATTLPLSPTFWEAGT